jgi:hypothetical protein
LGLRIRGGGKGKKQQSWQSRLRILVGRWAKCWQWRKKPDQNTVKLTCLGSALKSHHTQLENSSFYHNLVHIRIYYVTFVVCCYSVKRLLHSQCNIFLTLECVLGHSKVIFWSPGPWACWESALPLSDIPNP